MSFRRALLTALGLCAAASTPTRAQDARLVEAGYEITFAGFTGFHIDFTGRFIGNSYDAQSHAFKEGTMKALTMHYEGRNRAWGTYLPSGALPAGGSLSIVVGDKARIWAVQYGPGGTLSEQFNPEWKPAPKAVIPEDKKRGSLDPLTSVIFAGMAGDAACDRDGEVAEFAAELALPGRKPGFKALHICIRGDQRRCERELYEILREMGYHAAGVLVAERIGPLVYQAADFGFVDSLAVLNVHRASPWIDW